jgi:hypothetical protein
VSPPPPPPTGPAFVTYNALPAPTPPLDTSELVESHLPAPDGAPAPEVPAASEPPPATPAPPPPVAEAPAAPPPKRTKPPKPPKQPREPVSPGLIAAGIITLVLLIGSGVAALLLSRGDDDPKPAAVVESTAEPEETEAPRTGANLRQQVLTLDDLMKKSKQGRTAAAAGDTEAAIANRSDLLKDLQRLEGEAEDADLKAGLGSFVAAIRESLRQNRECADACSTADLDKVNALKRQTVQTLNPLLRKYAKTSYRGRDI